MASTFKPTVEELKALTAIRNHPDWGACVRVLERLGRQADKECVHAHPDIVHLHQGRARTVEEILDILAKAPEQLAALKK